MGRSDDCTSDENCDHPTHYKGCPQAVKYRGKK